MTLFKKLKNRLGRTRDQLVGSLLQTLRGHKSLDDELWEQMEDILIRGDVGVETSHKLLDEVKRRLHSVPESDPEKILELLQNCILEVFQNGTRGSDIEISSDSPHVILVVGVNGTGKTTSIAKLAWLHQQEGRKVLLAGCDTFRAAATEQLEIWADRLGLELVKNQPGADPAAVAYDALQAALARHADILIIDTAGRLHTKKNLMEELCKIKRVIAKQIQDGPHETILVLDAAVGQNAISQAQLFHRHLGISSIFLAKLDGTAKGGIVIAIADRLHIPVSYIGIGEDLDDLERFDTDQFVRALFSID
jgi:fused signal recognition particle receptor